MSTVIYSLSTQNSEIDLKPIEDISPTIKRASLDSILKTISSKGSSISPDFINRWGQIKFNITQKKQGFKGLLFKFLFWLSGGNGKIAKIDAELKPLKFIQDLANDNLLNKLNVLRVDEIDSDAKIEEKFSAHFKESGFTISLTEASNSTIVNLGCSREIETRLSYQRVGYILSSLTLDPKKQQLPHQLALRLGDDNERIYTHEEILKAYPEISRLTNITFSPNTKALISVALLQIKCVLDTFINLDPIHIIPSGLYCFYEAPENEPHNNYIVYDREHSKLDYFIKNGPTAGLRLNLQNKFNIKEYLAVLHKSQLNLAKQTFSEDMKAKIDSTEFNEKFILVDSESSARKILEFEEKGACAVWVEDEQLKGLDVSEDFTLNSIEI